MASIGCPACAVAMSCRASSAAMMASVMAVSLVGRVARRFFTVTKNPIIPVRVYATIGWKKVFWFDIS